MRRINEIIIHCTATRANQSVTLADIDRWHKERGFKGIGYHYVIDTNGLILVGRNEIEVGAHCEGRNLNSIGICYIGGLNAGDNHPEDTRTSQQKDAIIDLIKEIVNRHPIKLITGHNVYANKKCPCFNAKEEYFHLIEENA